MHQQHVFVVEGLQPGTSLSFALLLLLSSRVLLHHWWLVVVWLDVVSSKDYLYSITMCQGCLSTSVSAWGPFWSPVPRLRLRQQWLPDGGGVGFPLRGGVWVE
jgi:hypothetical protein